MNKTFFLLPFSLLLTAPIQSMKHAKTLFTQASKLSDLLALEHTKSEFKLNNWEDIQNTDPRIKNHVLRTILFTNYSTYRSKVKQLVEAGGDPNAPDQRPLAIALDNNDLNFATFLLHNYANPNSFVHPRLIDISDHQETGSSVNLNQLENKPAFYFAKTLELAQLCKDFGADARIGYCYHTQPYGYQKNIYVYGNVLTHIFDDANCSAELTKFYLENGAGPYCASDASEGGSALHHIIHTLQDCSTNHNLKRLLICSAYLLNKEPNLLQSQDYAGKTPITYLNPNFLPENKMPALKEFSELFKQYQTPNNAKRTRE